MCIRDRSIESLKRKYGGSIESVLQYVDKIQEELEELKGLSQKIADLKDRLSSLTAAYNKLANELSKARIISSKKLSTQIEEMMNQLNMEGAIFKVEIKQNSDHNSPIICGEDKVKYGPKGYDIVEFYLSANPGESIKPLAKVASGGEVSRIMLSIKSVLKEQDPVATLIFDEIDAGISGEAAEKVAKALKALSINKQVVCITHLPQIASLADNHLFVGKKVVENKTYVHTNYLDDKEKVEAVAKLFSGEGNIDQGINSKENFISRARG